MTESLTLTPQMVVVLTILAFTIYLFVSEIVRVDVAAVLVMVVLGLSGLVPGERLFDGFASNAVISIIAVMILGAGLDRTGIMNQLAGYILRVGGSTERRVIPIVSGTVGVISSFMQNVGAAALFIPVVSRISTRTGIPLSRLLMPMGFCALLGGTITMIGSSPLILLNDLILTSNRNLPESIAPMQTFHLFSVTPIGVVMLAVGIAYFVLAGRYVLPGGKGSSADPGALSRYFEQLYGIKGTIFETRVTLASGLGGQTVYEAEEQPDAPIIVGIRNGDEIRLEPPRDENIYVGSLLALMGTAEQVQQYAKRNRLAIRSNLQSFIEVLNPARAGVAEVVIPPVSQVIGKSVTDIGMRRRYGLSLLAVSREGHAIRKGLRNLQLRAGDALVVHCKWEDLSDLAKNRNFVVVTDFPRETSRPHKVLPAVVCFALALGLTLFTDLRLSLCLMLGAVGMIITGVLTVDEGYRSVGWQSVFLLASLLPLGAAVESTNTAAWIAQQTLALAGDVPGWILQTLLAALASFFTLTMSNVGATVLLVPLAVNIALGSGADPAVYALTVALAASNSFLLPTHQVNALIMVPAGYRVADFIRAGGGLSVLFLLVLIPMLNLLY